MPITTTIFPGRYIQGAGAISRLGEVAVMYGDKAFIIVDPFVYDNMLTDVVESIDKVMSTRVERFGGECSDEEIGRLAGTCTGESAVIVGIGGGKTLDAAKAVAHVLDLPIIVASTIASTDAACSALSVVYSVDGSFKGYLPLPNNPDVVIVDTEILSKAPVRYLAAGMGDALATWLDAEACQRSFAGNMSGDLGSMAAYQLAKLCYDVVLQYGPAAMVANEQQVVTPAFERVIEATLLLSGLGSENGGLASIHAIHNGLTTLDATHPTYHGELVGFSALVAATLTDKTDEVLDELYTFCETLGIPTTLAEIGLTDVTDADLMQVATVACTEGETTENESMPITPDMVFAALKTADGEGRRRKAEGVVVSTNGHKKMEPELAAVLGK